MARCSNSNTKNSFGIRIEQRGKDWERTWAFPIDERKAKREGYDSNTVAMTGENDPGYPGCPYCRDEGFAQCQCLKLGCQGGGRPKGKYVEYVCPWCGQKVLLQNVASVDVSGGGY